MFIIIETFGGLDYLEFARNEDGEILSFETMEEAENYAKENMQKGIVVSIED